VLDLAVTQPSPWVLTRAVQAAQPVTDQSPHPCRSTRSPTEATRSAPLLPPIDQCGYLPFPLQPLSPHSLSRRVRDLLEGDLGAHRDLPVDADEEPAVAAPASRPVAVPRGGAYSRADWEAALHRRHADHASLAGITDVLTDVEQRADELNRRAVPLLDGVPAVADSSAGIAAAMPGDRDTDTVRQPLACELAAPGSARAESPLRASPSIDATYLPVGKARVSEPQRTRALSHCVFACCALAVLSGSSLFRRANVN